MSSENIRGRDAFLSALVHGERAFVKQPDYLCGVSVLLDSVGIETRKVANGIITAEFGELCLPVAVVDSEDFFHHINPNPKYKIAKMKPNEWLQNKLIVVDANWIPNSIVADAVLQALYFQGKFDPSTNVVYPDGISEQAMQTVSPFLAKNLVGQYRGRWYQWLEYGRRK